MYIVCFSTLFRVFGDYMMFSMLWICIVLYSGWICVLACVNWRKSNILAQASGSRLSKSIRSSPRCLREMLLKQRAPILSEKPSRSGEEVLPKWENARAPLFLFSSSRLGERSSLERGLLAWARIRREHAHVLFSSLFLSDGHMLG